ncbi:MAG TPA: VOC family protein [Sporichthya sp.]|nr:VOC family protein [Sporichthya sp.]
MPVQLNHHIVRVRDKQVAAEYYADVLGLPPAKPFGPFLHLQLANAISLDFQDVEGEIPGEHYAFLVTEEEWDGIFDRLKARGTTYYADPFLKRPGEWNTDDGGRGLYWFDPDGHFLEILTRPYGGLS